MDFDGAVRAHSEWKSKLKDYLEKPDGSLKTDVVGADNKCALGQWIYGEGAKYSALTEYSSLKTEHAKFHKACCDVVKKADAGQSTSADTQLGSSSEFATASSAVVMAIMQMKMKAV
jgi:hypothetical protein